MEFPTNLEDGEHGIRRLFIAILRAFVIEAGALFWTGPRRSAVPELL